MLNHLDLVGGIQKKAGSHCCRPAQHQQLAAPGLPYLLKSMSERASVHACVRACVRARACACVRDIKRRERSGWE